MVAVITRHQQIPDGADPNLWERLCKYRLGLRNVRLPTVSLSAIDHLPTVSLIANPHKLNARLLSVSLSAIDRLVFTVSPVKVRKWKSLLG